MTSSTGTRNVLRAPLLFRLFSAWLYGLPGVSLRLLKASGSASGIQKGKGNVQTEHRPTFHKQVEPRFGRHPSICTSWWRLAMDPRLTHLNAWFQPCKERFAAWWCARWGYFSVPPTGLRPVNRLQPGLFGSPDVCRRLLWVGWVGGLQLTIDGRTKRSGY